MRHILPGLHIKEKKLGTNYWYVGMHYALIAYSSMQKIHIALITELRHGIQTRTNLYNVTVSMKWKVQEKAKENLEKVEIK